MKSRFERRLEAAGFAYACELFPDKLTCNAAMVINKLTVGGLLTPSEVWEQLSGLDDDEVLDDIESLGLLSEQHYDRELSRVCLVGLRTRIHALVEPVLPL